jgi:hypothetical protein
MANLKRNMIELVKEVKEGEIVTEKYLTPVFIPFDVTYKAVDLASEWQDSGSKKTEREMLDTLIDFVANDVYNGQFTVTELKKGLHAPDAAKVLYDQVQFISQGQQDEETKKFLEKKR